MSVRLDHEDGVATVTLDRPERHNALDGETLTALADAVEDAGDARVIVLRGAGDDAFSAGADVQELAEFDVEEATEYVDAAHRAMEALARAPQPTIAAIQGYCLGGGWELALACDLRVASERAVLGHTEVDLAVVPAWGGLRKLVRLVGDEFARRLVYFGERIDAQDAYDYGLVGEVVAHDQLDGHVEDLAADLAAKPPFALQANKEALYSAWGPQEEDRQYLRRLWGALFGGEEQQAAMEAFLEE